MRGRGDVLVRNKLEFGGESLRRFVVDARATPSVHSENQPAGRDFDFV